MYLIIGFSSFQTNYSNINIALVSHLFTKRFITLKVYARFSHDFPGFSFFDDIYNYVY